MKLFLSLSLLLSLSATFLAKSEAAATFEVDDDDLYDDEDEDFECFFNPNCRLETQLPKTPDVIYLTFDDGPNEGTGPILDVLKKHDVPATFFVLGNQLMASKVGQPNQVLNGKNVLRILKEGHAIADHSYNHMFHNSMGSTNSYLDVAKDIRYFNKGNSGNFRKALLAQGVSRADVSEFISTNLLKMARLPYTNNWRVTMDNGNEVFHNCEPCTRPASSGHNGVLLADKLHDKGIDVYGWDYEMAMDYSINRLVPSKSGADLFHEMTSLWRYHTEGKIVVLCHDYAFRPDYYGQFVDENPHAKVLEDLVVKAKEAGYTFATLRDYPKSQ